MKKKIILSLLAFGSIMSATQKEQKTVQVYEEIAEGWIKRHGIEGTAPSFWISYINEFENYLSSGAHILDIGFGGGREVQTFIEKGYSVAGIDPCQKFVSTMQKHFLQSNFVKGSVYEMPFADNSFDALWCTSVLLHVSPRTLPFALQEMHRVLKPGGVAFVSFSEGMGNIQHKSGRWFYMYQQKKFTHLLTTYGFEITKIEQLENRGSDPWLHQCVVIMQKKNRV